MLYDIEELVILFFLQINIFIRLVIVNTLVIVVVNIIEELFGSDLSSVLL